MCSTISGVNHFDFTARAIFPKFGINFSISLRAWLAASRPQAGRKPRQQFVGREKAGQIDLECNVQRAAVVDVCGRRCRREGTSTSRGDRGLSCIARSTTAQPRSQSPE